MSTFRKQIEQDIIDYKSKFKHIPNISKDAWAFNYWVLDKLFFEDEELIEEKIIDYRDYGIDAYEVYEDTKEIFLIQNKYYSDSTSISADYVKNDFLIRGISALENGTYPRSEELQIAFNKYKGDADFTVYLQLFVTNNKHCKEADDYIKEFNRNHPKYRAEIYYLDDIKERYYGETETIRQNISVKIVSVNKSTILNINTDAYKLENVIDARYVLTPVVSVYRMYREAIEKNYPIFDKNIREYLGNTGGINKGIYKTLLDKEDRKNFFYYNNGVTVICDKMGKIATQSLGYNMNAYFEIDNPQIVNGCQTVNSIYKALETINPSELEREFKDTFVMLKILEIDRGDSEDKSLYKDIVVYNNSQNSINEKTFAANKSEFNRLQKEFKSKGFLLLIKQSDKNKFNEEYKTVSELRKLNKDRINKFGLKQIEKAKDAHIPLEKLLQVINAFVSGGHIAYTKKSNMLKSNSEQYNTAIRFIKNDAVTSDTILDLYLLYMRAEQRKAELDDERAPIPYYLVDFFAKYECNERDVSRITSELSDPSKISAIVRLYTAVTKGYAKSYHDTYNIDYNKMIKQSIKYELVDQLREMANVF